MPSAPSSQGQTQTPFAAAEAGISPVESVEYSKQMIESLQQIAERQGHRLLSQLLKLAAEEARSILSEAA